MTPTPTVTFILGLCGAGKTHLAERMIVDCEPFEDFRDDRNKHRSLLDHLRRGESCVVIEIAYCHKLARDDIVREITNAVPNVHINWICIENDLAKANKNCRERTNKGSPVGHADINGRVSPGYTYPEGAVILKMWTKEP